jgi:hypothetical protein
MNYNNTTTITTTVPIFLSSILKTQIQNALTRISTLPLFLNVSYRSISPLDQLVYPNAEGYTPLHYAAASDDFDFAKSLVFILVSVGRADLLSTMDLSGRTPLHWAVDAGSMGIVRLLIENGVMPNPQDHDGLSPLHIVISKCSCKSDRWPKYREIFGYLIARADINIADINGVSALHLAAELGDVESIRSLIEHGAWVNTQDHQGENPLFYAVRGNQYQVIRALVEEFGINMDMVNEDEEHILDLCRAIGQPCLTDLVKLLYNGRIIHQKMICCLQDPTQTSEAAQAGFKGSGQNIEIIANHSGYIRLSGHSCA